MAAVRAPHITTTSRARQEHALAPEPFLKWAGGKGRMLRQFARFFPPRFGHYYEPFLGSGAVFLHLLPPSACLSDSNPNLIAAYQHVQNRLDDLLPLLYRLRRAYHALPPAQQQREYYHMRERYNQLRAGTLEKTALLIVLNKTGYNGLYRENARGGFNVPFGRYNNPAMFREENLRAVAQALQGAEVLHASFSEAVANAQAGDFVYFDPPYMPSSKTASFTSYTRGKFGPERQVALAEEIRRLAARGVLVMLSNSDTPFIRDLYRGLYHHEVSATRVINSRSTGRGKLRELVITSYPVEEGTLTYASASE
jgi:DNA adenine methylase